MCFQAKVLKSISAVSKSRNFCGVQVTSGKLKKVKVTATCVQDGADVVSLLVLKLGFFIFLPCSSETVLHYPSGDSLTIFQAK